MEDGSTLPPCSVILARKDTPRLVGISVPQISFNTAQTANRNTVSPGTASKTSASGPALSLPR
jgi:hypothetical protein